MDDLEMLNHNLFSDKEKIQFHMFSARVHNWIVSKGNSGHVTENDWSMVRNVQFRQKIWSLDTGYDMGTTRHIQRYGNFFKIKDMIRLRYL